MLVEVRSCCSAPGATGTFREIADTAPTFSTGDVLVANVEPAPRNMEDAFHEAAHASAAFVLGVPAGSITIDPPNPHVKFGAIGDDFANSVLTLAGPAGGLLAHRREHREHPESVAETYRRVSECWPGKCDQCIAMRASIRLAGFDETRATAIYRKAETAAWLLVGQRPVARLIRATADQLMAEGTISGADFHALASQIIDPATLENLRTLAKKET